jgi:hypothetical protein
MFVAIQYLRSQRLREKLYRHAEHEIASLLLLPPGVHLGALFNDGNNLPIALAVEERSWVMASADGGAA